MQPEEWRVIQMGKVANEIFLAKKPAFRIRRQKQICQVENIRDLWGCSLENKAGGGEQWA